MVQTAVRRLASVVINVPTIAFVVTDVIDTTCWCCVFALSGPNIEVGSSLTCRKEGPESRLADVKCRTGIVHGVETERFVFAVRMLAACWHVIFTTVRDRVKVLSATRSGGFEATRTFVIVSAQVVNSVEAISLSQTVRMLTVRWKLVLTQLSGFIEVLSIGARTWGTETGRTLIVVHAYRVRSVFLVFFTRTQRMLTSVGYLGLAPFSDCVEVNLVATI